MVQDENGTTLPNAEHTISFEISGPGRLIGINPVKAEAGVAAILLQVCEDGKIEIKAKSEGLKQAGWTIQV